MTNWYQEIDITDRIIAEIREYADDWSCNMITAASRLRYSPLKVMKYLEDNIQGLETTRDVSYRIWKKVRNR